MNKVFLIGNLTKDPELTETNNGTSVCRVGLAVNRRSQSGDQTADFYNLTAFRGIAETIAKYKKKGDKIAVVGDIQIRQYEGNDGIKRTTVDVIVNEVEFLGQKPREDDLYDDGAVPQSKGAQKPRQLSIDDDDDDIPF